MPFIELKTNVDLVEEVKKELTKELGQSIQLLKKTEDWLMINLVPNQNMYFKGSDEPCVMIDVKLFGNAPRSCYDEFTFKITKVVASLLNVSPGRIYVSYLPYSTWGWAGSNF